MTDLISFVPAATTSTSATDPTAELSGNFDTFLKILTAQIQNQDPLQPMDSTQFTQQLVQFSGVEQQIKTNTSLDSLIKGSQSNTGASLAGYLGQSVEINQSGAEFNGKDPVTWNYALPSTAASTTVTVTDATGNVIYSEPGETGTGTHSFTWNGQLFNGNTATDAPYYIKVVATDANSKAITPYQSVVATVTGVDFTYGEPALTTTAGIYSYSDIMRVTQH